MSPIWVKCVNLTRYCQNALNLHIVVDYGVENCTKTAKNGKNWQKTAKNDVHGLLRALIFRTKKFYGLRCLVLSVGNKLRCKIYSNQVNRLACLNCPKEIMFFPHLGPVILRLKFGSLFQNSHRSNDLPNS